MRIPLLVSTLVAFLSGGLPADAQDHDTMGHHQHMAATPADVRQAVDFPPPMRAHILSNMRDHLLALSEIMTAMSGGAYADAASIAKKRLGMDSPAAESCRAPDAKGGAAPMSQSMNMERMMAEFMPEGMRDFGLAMHQAASDFAAEAAQVDKSGDAKPAFAALARVTRQCAACHAAYRVH